MTSSKRSRRQYYNFEEIYEKILDKKISIKKARELQKYISENLNEIPIESFNLLAGLDCAYYKDNVVTSIVFFNVEEKKIMYQDYSISKVIFPYIPTLLFLREGPLYVKMIREAKIKADVYLIDGHGKAHPLRAGLASFVGFYSKMPTIGVAKSRLFGSVQWKNEEGDLMADDEIIGKAIKICNRIFYVSVGCNINLESSLKVFRSSIVGCECYPITKAHELCTKIANDLKIKQ